MASRSPSRTCTTWPVSRPRQARRSIATTWPRGTRPSSPGCAQSGAVIVGKLQMTEGAYGTHHPTIPAPVNPWNAAYWTGVSSSGSGAATAAGLCFASLGSDTGGSIRFPSTMNGVTGLKPTWGRVSRAGVFALAKSLDHVGPMCRSALDAAIMLGVIAGADLDDPTAAPRAVPDYAGSIDAGVDGKRLGVPKNLAGVDDDASRSDRWRDRCAPTRRRDASRSGAAGDLRSGGVGLGGALRCGGGTRPRADVPVPRRRIRSDAGAPHRAWAIALGRRAGSSPTASESRFRRAEPPPHDDRSPRVAGDGQGDTDDRMDDARSAERRKPRRHGAATPLHSI